VLKETTNLKVSEPTVSMYTKRQSMQFIAFEMFFFKTRKLVIPHAYYTFKFTSVNI